MEMCFGAAWEVYVQGAFLAWERVLAHCRERGKTPVTSHIVPPVAACRLFAGEMQSHAVFLDPFF